MAAAAAYGDYIYGGDTWHLTPPRTPSYPGTPHGQWHNPWELTDDSLHFEKLLAHAKMQEYAKARRLEFRLFGRLPRELQLEIFKYADTTSLLKCQQVSRMAYRLVRLELVRRMMKYLAPSVSTIQLKCFNPGLRNQTEWFSTCLVPVNKRHSDKQVGLTSRLPSPAIWDLDESDVDQHQVRAMEKLWRPTIKALPVCSAQPLEMAIDDLQPSQDEDMQNVEEDLADPNSLAFSRETAQAISLQLQSAISTDKCSSSFLLSEDEYFVQVLIDSLLVCDRKTIEGGQQDEDDDDDDVADSGSNTRSSTGLFENTFRIHRDWLDSARIGEDEKVQWIRDGTVGIGFRLVSRVDLEEDELRAESLFLPTQRYEVETSGLYIRTGYLLDRIEKQLYEF